MLRLGWSSASLDAGPAQHDNVRAVPKMGIAVFARLSNGSLTLQPAGVTARRPAVLLRETVRSPEDRTEGDCFDCTRAVCSPAYSRIRRRFSPTRLPRPHPIRFWASG